MRPGAVRVIAALVVIGLVVSIALGSALPIVLAVCISGLVAAGSIRSNG
jgi:hypothetical protein